MNHNASGLPGLGLFIAVGLALCGYFIGKSLSEFKAAERFVTVKGLAERDVKTDLAVWPIKFRATGNELISVQAKIEEDQKKLFGFLEKEGLKKEEFESSGLRVVDLMAREYRDQKSDNSRYIIESTVTLRSTNVDLVQKLSSMLGELVKSGIVFADDNSCASGPKFLFTRLNDIKPEMLAEATRNAREAAGQFAADSGSNVGIIRRAYQGVFSITPRDNISENSEGGYYCGADSVFRKVRVVTTVDYELESGI